MINLACLRGNIGFWTFYSTVMKVRDLVNENRVITVSESSLYTNNINKILQREIKQNRIKSITKYLETNDERFMNSLIVAVHRGSPKWTDIDLYEKIEVDGNVLDENDINFLGSKFGILTLKGDEEIFALDGQHRLKGIRKAFEEKPELGDFEIPVIFVIHNQTQVDKTRRLFTVLNKYAEKPKGAELIILDEDDVAAINTRKLVMEHPVLSKEKALSKSQTGAISNSDNSSFTTLVTLYNINKKLYSKPKNYYTSRPNQQAIDDLYAKSLLFWNKFFEVFPEIEQYINGVENIMLNDTPIYRSSESGGSLLLRPVGQELIANAFTRFRSNELNEFSEKLRNINFNLSGNIWKYIFWNGKMLGGNARLKNNILLFILGKYDNQNEIHSEIARVYELNNQVYNNHVEQL